MATRINNRVRRIWACFARSEDGAALVEFAIAVPMMLVVFAVIVEGGQMLINYQNAITGVRDATRYLSRVVPSNICPPAGSGSVASHAGKVTTIVTQTITNASAFGGHITVNSVTPSLACSTGTYRISPVGVTSVTANLTITFPFGNIFSFVGAPLTPVTTSVTDSAKAYGT